MDASPDDQADADFQDTVELVRRAQAGDGGALADVLRRYYPRVLGIVRARLGSRLRTHLESGDLVQEAMGEALGAFDRFDMKNEEALLRWLARLVENRIRDAAKFYGAEKRDAGREVPLRMPSPETEAPGHEPAESTLSPLDRVSQRELSDRLRLCVQRLSPRHQEVIERRGALASWADIAAAMGLETPGAARMLHARAKVALMKELALEPDD